MCIISAAKFYDDKFYENKYYANIGGIKVHEFVLLEKELLFTYLDFQLYIKPETFILYAKDVMNYYKEKICVPYASANE